MTAALDKIIIPYDDVLRSQGGHFDRKGELIDATARHYVAQPASGTPVAPASTTAVDVDHHIDGLVDVITSLDNTTAPAPVSDQELSRNVMQLLQRISGVPFEGIRTEISHGCVTLLGAVASAAVSKEIEQGVQHLPGVCSVTNRIMIQEIQQ